MYVTHKLLWCYVQILTLQKPHVPASFNMYLVINKWVTAVNVSNFSGQYLRNHWTLDIGVLGYIGRVWPKEHSPGVWSVPSVTLCILYSTADLRNLFALDLFSCGCLSRSKWNRFKYSCTCLQDWRKTQKNHLFSLGIDSERGPSKHAAWLPATRSWCLVALQQL